ncbi:MAG: hypothetical protein LBI47_01955, partial [Puniceicoccales bacterium]|nr:hypothetical protein [Puniceicoccales bacterium]
MDALKIVYGYDCDEGCQYADLYLGENVAARVSENTRYLADELIDGKCPIAAPQFAESCFEKLDIGGAIAKSKNIMDALRALFVYDDSGKFQIALDSRHVKKIEFDVDTKDDKDLKKVLEDREFKAIGDLVLQASKAPNNVANANETPNDAIKVVHEPGDEKKTFAYLSSNETLKFIASKENDAYKLIAEAPKETNEKNEEKKSKVVDKALNPGTTVALDAIFDEDAESAFYKLLGDCTVKKVTFDVSAEDDKIFK